jgi:hypothetical protein
MDTFHRALSNTLVSAKPLVEVDGPLAQRVHPQQDNLLSTTLVAERLPFPPGHPAREVASNVLRTYAPRGSDGEPDFDRLFADGTIDVEGVTYVSRLNGALHPVVVSSLIKPIQGQWQAVRNNNQARNGFWSHRRARPLDRFIPVEPSALDAMIRGWGIGRILGMIPDPTRDNGFAIARSQGDACFPWPLLCGDGIVDPLNVVSWLPMVLESLPIAFAMYPLDTASLDAYDELYLLGQTQRNNPGPHYSRIGEELKTWIDSGLVSAPSPNPPMVSGSDASERRTGVVEMLHLFSATLHERLAEFPNRPDDQFLKSKFFTLPAGFELFDRIAKVYEDLSRTCAATVHGNRKG